MTTSFAAPRPLGADGPLVSRIGLGSSYGVGADDVEHAVDRGVTLLYWGTLRRDSFGEGVSRVARRERGRVQVVVQSYTRVAFALRWSVMRALKSLKLDRADVLLLGMWNQPPPPRIRDAALALKEEGLVGALMLSCHRRATFEEHARDPAWSALMVRYNAAHPGAEQDVFPLVRDRPAAMVAYTATCWGRLLDRKLQPPDEPLPRGSDCYRFALSHPAVSHVLAGPRDRGELDEALLALDRGPMDDEELAWMKRVGAALR